MMPVKSLPTSVHRADVPRCVPATCSEAWLACHRAPGRAFPAEQRHREAHHPLQVGRKLGWAVGWLGGSRQRSGPRRQRSWGLTPLESAPQSRHSRPHPLPSTNLPPHARRCRCAGTPWRSWGCDLHQKPGTAHFRRCLRPTRRCRHTLAPEHFADRGYNALQFSHAANCWARNVTVLNADNGLFVSWTDRSTFRGAHAWMDGWDGWTDGSQQLLAAPAAPEPAAP